jgi:hypothetical protein
MTDDEKPRIHEPEGEAKLIVEVSRGVPLVSTYARLEAPGTPGTEPQRTRRAPQTLRYAAAGNAQNPDSITGLAFTVNNQTAIGPADTQGREG